MTAIVSGQPTDQTGFAPTSLPPMTDAIPTETLPPVVHEELPASLSLDDLERIALHHNPTLTSARAQIAAALGRQVQAGLYPNPIMGYNAMEVGTAGTAGQQGGFVAQRFITGRKLRLDRAIAGQEIRQSRSQFTAQELRVLNDVQLRYYESLAAQRQVELAEQLTATSRRLVQASQQLLDGRQISESDLLQAEIEAEETTILTNNATNRREEAWRRLIAVLGMPRLAILPLSGELAGELPELDWQSSYDRILGNHPLLASAQARIDRARFAIERARRENIPNVDTTVTVGHAYQSDSDVVGIRVGGAIPIFNRNQGNIMSANAEFARACSDVRRIKLLLQDELAQSFRRYADARQQAARYQREILPRAERSLDLVGQGYRQGQVDYLTLLTSQRTYIRVNIAFVDALAEVRKAATLIDGQLLSDNLRAESP